MKRIEAVKLSVAKWVALSMAASSAYYIHCKLCDYEQQQFERYYPNIQNNRPPCGYCPMYGRWPTANGDGLTNLCIDKGSAYEAWRVATVRSNQEKHYAKIIADALKKLLKELEARHA